MQETTIIGKLGGFVTRHPWGTLLVSTLLVLVLAAGMLHLGFKNDYRIYFSKENPQLKAFEAIQDTYSKSDNVMFVLDPGLGDVFTPRILQAVHRLTEGAWQLSYSSRVDSITNFQHTTAEGDDLTVADLVADPEALSAAQIQAIKRVALGEPLLVNRLLSPTGHVTGINVTVQLPGKSSMEAMKVVAEARELAARIEAQYPGIELYLTGMVMMNNAFAESSMNDNQTLVPIMYGIVIGVLLLSLRSITATLGVVLLIVLSIVSALGIAGWLRWDMTPTSAIAPTIILTMAVADCVHLLVTMLHNMRIGHEKRQAIQESIRINFQPIFLTSATTAIGFLSMNFSDAPPFRDLGNIVAMGVVMAFLLTVSFLPAFMTILPVRVKLQDDLDNRPMRRLADFVIRRRRALLVVNGLLAIGLTSFVPLNELNDEFVKYFDESIEFRRSTDFFNDNLGGLYSMEFSIHAGSEGGISEPDYLQSLQRFADWLEEQPEVIHVHSITDTFKRLNKNMHGDDPSWYRLPERRDLAAQYLLLYEMSLPYGLDLNDQIDIDKSAVRLIATMQSMSSRQVLALERRVRDWLQVNMPASGIEAASPVLMFAHIGKRNIIRMVGGTLLALVLISFILIAAFRSLKLGLISLIPNLVPAGIAFGIWGLIDGQIGLGLSVVTGMTLGIVVDDTVHFISKYRRARIEKHMDSQAAVRYAFSTVGVALWITSLVLVSGFLVLSLSHFTMNSDMGLMTAITIAVALFLDFLFLPPLLMTLEKK